MAMLDKLTLYVDTYAVSLQWGAEGNHMTSSARSTSRIAGALYLINGVFSAFAILFVSAKVYVPGNAAASAANVVASSGLVRAGIVADLVQATVFVFLGMTIYLLLRHVHENMARALVILVAIATTIMCLDKVFQFVALRVATDAASCPRRQIRSPAADRP